MSRLIVESIDWNDAAQAALSIDAPCSVLDIKKQVIEDKAVLFQVSDFNTHDVLCYYVLRVDALVNGNEGVVIAMVAVNHQSGLDLVRSLEPIVIGQLKNCISIRLHTFRAGMVKKLSSLGWQPQEFVMSKKLC
jgi:hypothetical protein